MNVFSRPLALLLLTTLAGLFIGCNSKGNEAARSAIRQTMLNDLATQVIEPFHLAFLQKAKALEIAAQKFESDPTDEHLSSVQAAWIEAAQNWRRLSALNLPGPVRSGIYHFRINTWPTKTTTIEENIKTAETIDASYIDRVGSNARGLPALEYLFFADGTEEVLQAMQSNPRRRAYASAVAQNVATKAAGLLHAWSRQGENQLESFEQANTEGRNLQSSLSRMVNEMAMVMEDIRHMKLGDPMGIATTPEDSNADPKPMMVESPYAQISNKLILADLEGIRALITANEGTGLDDYLASLNATFEDKPLGEVILAQIDKIETIIQNHPSSIKTMVVDNPNALMPAYEESRQLIRLIKTDMANWLSVSITFNDNDGD